MLAEIAEADEADVDAAVKAARKAYDKVWSKMPGRERAKYLYRIARIIQERSRELAVLESIDNGKPIKESRDVDVPIVAAHFFYYAGWADKLEYAGRGTDPQPLGVAGQVIPWNFPLLMLAWKIAPALACGNTVVLKPAETTPLTALLFAEICQQADLPPGVVNIITGAGGTGQALVGHPGIDKVAFTGSTEVGKAIARTVAGTDKKVTLELGGKAANIVFDDAPLDQAVEGIVTGIFFNQGHVCCAGSRLLVQESIADELLDQAQAPDVDAARRRPARQEHRHRRDQLRRAARPDPRAVRHRRGRGRRALVARVRAAVARLLVPADALHRRHPGPPDRPRGDLRPGAVRADLPHAVRGGREGQQHAVRPVRRGLDREGLADPVDGQPAARRRRLGQHVQQVRPDQPVRRVQGVGLRPRGRPPRSGGVPQVSDRIDVRKTYKLYIGGAFPRSESAYSYEVTDSKGKFVANAALASRKDARDAVIAARKAFGSWSGRTAYNRAQVLYRIAEVMEDRRPQFVQAVVQSEGLTAPARPRRSSTPPSTGSSGTPAGPTRSPRSSATPTRSPARSSTSRRPSRPASSPCSRRRSPRCSGWSASSRR